MFYLASKRRNSNIFRNFFPLFFLAFEYIKLLGTRIDWMGCGKYFLHRDFFTISPGSRRKNEILAKRDLSYPSRYILSRKPQTGHPPHRHPFFSDIHVINVTRLYNPGCIYVYIYVYSRNRAHDRLFPGLQQFHSVYVPSSFDEGSHCSLHTRVRTYAKANVHARVQLGPATRASLVYGVVALHYHRQRRRMARVHALCICTYHFLQTINSPLRCVSFAWRTFIMTMTIVIVLEISEQHIYFVEKFVVYRAGFSYIAWGYDSTIHLSHSPW